LATEWPTVDETLRDIQDLSVDYFPLPEGSRSEYQNSGDGVAEKTSENKEEKK